MGVKALLLLIFCWLLKSTLGDNDTCTEKCKLLVDGNDLSAEFQSKSSEDGVRMVYLHLNVGNESYNPLQSRDKFFPNRWTWARGVEEPMLYFSYQYQVLSLGLLKNQVRNMKVTLSDEPRGCVRNLTSSSKDILVATTLLEKITDASTDPSLSEDVVCVSVVKRDINWLHSWFEGNIQYHCCKQEQSGNETVVQCDLPVQYNKWYMLFYHVLTLGIIVLFFFWPAVIPWLQKQSADDMENINRNIPVDDLSPISCGALWSKLSKHFRIRYERIREQTIVDRMVMAYYFRILFYAYIVLVLNYAFFSDYLTEADAKNAFPENALFYYVFDIRSSKLYCLIPVIIFFIILPAIFIFFSAYVLEKIEQDISTGIFENMNVFRKLHLNFLYRFIMRVPETKRENLKPAESAITWSCRVVLYLKKKSVESKKIVFVILFLLLSTAFVIFRVLLVLLSYIVLIVVEVPLFLVSVILLLAGDVIRWSPFSTLIKNIFTSVKVHQTIPDPGFFQVLFLAWLVYFSLAVIMCCSFYIRMFGFVVVGLIINAEKTTPYVGFLFVFISNVSLCYNTFRKRFKEMKKIIFKYYKKRTTSLPNEETISKTIPEELFWYICEKVLPIGQEILAMLTSLLIISSISLLALAIIFFFGEVFNSSTLVEAGAVLLSGKLTGILFNGLIRSEKFKGEDKINKSKDIKYFVDEWINLPECIDKKIESEDEEETLERREIRIEDRTRESDTEML